MIHEYNQLVKHHDLDDFAKVLSDHPISFVLCIYCFIFLWSIGGLALYHTWLISHNLTTHEQIQRSRGLQKGDKVNPFHTGSIWKNCATVLCRPRISS
jgi:palmitoyltransferase ZDHHC9/14/18